LEHPELELSNNMAENAMRPVALGRRTWIHVGSEEAGPRVAAIVSVVETCRRLKNRDSRLSLLDLAGAFICRIEIQAKNVFFRVFASAIGEIFVFSDDFKTAFLQHSYRPDVVRCCPGENRPIYNEAEHPIERLSR
jgi:hypothetical protein